MASYTGIIFKDVGTDYGVHFPDLPGCITVGLTMDEALANAQQAIAFHVDMLAKDGDDIPEPRTLEELAMDVDVKSDIDAGGIMIQVPLLSTSSVKKRVELQMDKNLLEAIDRRAKTFGTTRTAIISDASRQYLDAG